MSGSSQQIPSHWWKGKMWFSHVFSRVVQLEAFPNGATPHLILRLHGFVSNWKSSWTMSFSFLSPCLNKPSIWSRPAPVLRRGSLYEAPSSGTNATDQGFPEVVHDLSGLMTPVEPLRLLGEGDSAAPWSHTNHNKPTEIWKIMSRSSQHQLAVT